MKTAVGEEEVEEYLASVVVSNAEATITYLKLILAYQPIPFREALRSFVGRNPPKSNLSRFLGLSRNPRDLGFKGESHWIYDGLDQDEIFAGRGECVEGEQPQHIYLFFQCLKDPRSEAYTAKTPSFTDYEYFSRWRDRHWRNLGKDHEAIKERLSEALIAFVNRFFPGFADLVEYRELTTPLTNEFFTQLARVSL